MRSRPFSLLVMSLPALAVIAACASPESDATDPPKDPHHPEAMVEEAAETTVSIDAASGVYGDLDVEYAKALLTTYSEESRAAVTNDLTRTVSMEAIRENGGRRTITALRLKDGKILAGRVLNDDGRVVEFQFETTTGMKGTTSVDYAALHPDSVADLMLARADDQDAGALMDVAEYAAAQGMYDVARVSYLAAVQADGTVKEIAEARLKALADQAASAELDRGRGAASSGDDLRARRILRRVQREFAGMPAADEAASAVAEIDARIAQRKVDEKRNRQLKPIEKLYDDSVDLTGKGLKKSSNPTTAIRTFLLARSKTTSARRKVDAAYKQAERSGDGELQTSLDDLGQRLDMQELDNELQLGTSYLDKGDYSKARAAARAALAIDGEDKEALSLMTQISEAEEEARYDNYDDYYNGYWGYGRGNGWYRWRRYRPRPTPYPRGWYPGRGQRWGSIRSGPIRTGSGIRGGAFRGGGRR